MPWQADRVGTRVAAVALLLGLALSGAACSGDDPGVAPAPDPTSDADCAPRVPDPVFTALGWTATGEPPEATVRGCHREAQEGYVEVRDRTGYDKLCRTLDRSGGVGPGAPADWVGDGVEACAVEPAGDVGQTKVVARREGDDVTQVTVAVLTATSQDRVRAAVRELVAIDP